jgi:hypothetical protein
MTTLSTSRTPPDLFNWIYRGGPAPPVPFVETGGENQTAATLEIRAKRRLLSNRFGSSVDELVADLRVFGPVRNQAPLVQIKGARTRNYDGNRLRRGNVVTRPKLPVHLGDPEHLVTLRGHRVKVRAHSSTHGFLTIKR